LIRSPTAAIAAVLLLAFAHTAAAATEPVRIDARPFAKFRFADDTSTFGDLTFLGGLELHAGDENFGSFSGLEFSPDGRLYAITDRGWWMSADLIEDAGVPRDLSDAWMAPMTGPDGARLDGKSRSDAEALRLDADGALLVAYEGIDAIRRFTLPLDPDAAPRDVSLPGFVRGLRRNSGLEALARAPSSGPLGGAMVAIAERSTDRSGNHRGFVLGGARAGAFAIGRSGGFDVTDAAFLPDGNLLLLERRFSFNSGLAVRLSRVRSDLIRPGRTVTGEVLLEALPGDQIDNLEGLAVRHLPDGAALITLISDDNHNLLQRTLLLQFRLEADVPPIPRLRP